MVSTRAETQEVANYAVSLAPGDPQTHYAAAVLYDRTLLAEDQELSLAEYQTAVEVSPHNYLLWLEYGKALGRAGEADRAEAALRRAQGLAPNYSTVQWALGNLLLRNGKPDEGFAQIRKAVNGDRNYAVPATAFAYQFLDGDLASVVSVVGTSADANAALTMLLMKAKRFDEALSVWRAIDHSHDDESVKALAHSVATELKNAKRFADAMQVSSSLYDQSTFQPESLNDGGFEEGVKLEGADDWEWQISPGTQPQPLQTTAGTHGGTKALLLRFASNDGVSLRSLSQTVVVHSQTSYTFNGFYRSDIKASSPVVWQVAGASDNSILGESTLNPGSAQWTSFTIKFTVPAGSDGVVVRFMVKGCGSAICPINGSVWFDDLALTPSQ